MGASGRKSAPGREQRTPQDADANNGFASTFLRVPVEKPPFTLSDLKRSIPPHCFRRSVLRSVSYVVVDLAFVALFLHIALAYIPALPSLLHLAAWPLYWAAQGCTMMAIWVLAHECGHQAFSDYPLLNDLLGLVLHSALLTPYFSWKYSHRRHHSNAGCMEADETFIPKPKEKVAVYYKYLNNPLGRLFVIAVMLTLGWPLYAAVNASGRKYDRFASHYDPYSPIYSDRERTQILVSDAGMLSVCYALYRLASAYGFWWLVRVYGVPLLITNGFLVLITYLHHTHLALPHYESSEWDWLRGALSTVDRDYGILNKVLHNITDTHVVHHLFSTIPHYHAVEATKAIKPLLGDYYRLDTTPVAKALWREVKECLYVEPDSSDDAKIKGILWYKNKY